MKRAIKWLLKRWGYSISKESRDQPQICRLPPLSDTQEKFIEWNALRLNIPRETARERYLESLSAFPDGHGGEKYKEFCNLSYRVFGGLYGDTEAEIFSSYPFYGPLHMLRFLSYPEKNIYTANTDFIGLLKERTEITILDFGCGLAHESRGMARAFLELNKPCRLLLADIPTIRKDFALYLCRQAGIDAAFFDCRAEMPVPAFPKYDLLVATEIFEHVYDPVKYFEALNANLNKGGLIYTNVSDHHREFMHVSPNLEKLRTHIIASGFQEIRDHTLFQKPY